MISESSIEIGFEMVRELLSADLDPHVCTYASRQLCIEVRNEKSTTPTYTILKSLEKLI